MVGAKRKRHTEEFKAKVALEAIRGVRTLSELSSMHRVRPTVIGHWNRQLTEGAAGLTADQVEYVYRDITAKRRATRYQHMKPLLVESVDEIAS